MTANRAGSGGGAKGVRIALAVLAAVLLIGLGEWIRGDRPEAASAADRPDLRAGALVGCWEVGVEPWTLTAWEGRRTEPPVPGAAGGPADEEPGPRRVPDRRPRTTGPSAPPPPELSPPRTVMLLPGSVDRWGRRLPSRRAVAVPDSPRSRRRLRWFVRADTLWVVWSEGAARAGVALFADGDSMVGMARGVDRRDSIDGSARARAWRVNCATGARERKGARPRR